MQMNDKSQTSVPEEKTHRVFLQGGGTGDPTVVFGQGITAKFVATGRISLTWKNAKDNPGHFLGLGGQPALRDATQANVKDHTVTAGAYDSTAQSIEIDIWDGTAAAANLAATSFLDVTLVFSGLSSTKL